MYAVIETGGKQYKVKEGDVIDVEKLNVDVGSRVVFDKVLSIGGDSPKFGRPFVEGASVSAQTLSFGKGKKIIVYKYKAKKNYHKKRGHRQTFARLKIESISV